MRETFACAQAVADDSRRAILMDIQVRTWDTICKQAMSRQTIAALYQPESAYRISEYTYPAGAKFQGAMREGTCYVLAGAFQWTSDQSVWIRAGEFATLPQGEYQIEVAPTAPVTMIKVWELPLHIRQ